MGSTFNGLIGLVILALDIWAIINVIKSNAETGIKISPTAHREAETAKAHRG